MYLQKSTEAKKQNILFFAFVRKYFSLNLFAIFFNFKIVYLAYRAPRSLPNDLYLFTTQQVYLHFLNYRLRSFNAIIRSM